MVPVAGISEVVPEADEGKLGMDVSAWPVCCDCKSMQSLVILVVDEAEERERGGKGGKGICT